MDDSERRATRKGRGKGFPVLSLPDAISALQEAGRYGFEHPRAALAGYLGHDSAASGPFRRKIAALRDWGVIAVDGDTVRFTDLGKRLAMPEPERELPDRQEAFRNADLFAVIYDNSAKGRDLELESLGNSAVLQHGVGVASKAFFTKSFMASAISAGLAEETGSGRIRLIDARKPPTRETEPDPSHSRPRGSAERVFSQTWTLPEGAVELNVFLEHPMPLEAYEHLRGVASAAQELAAAIGFDPQSNETKPRVANKEKERRPRPDASDEGRN